VDPLQKKDQKGKRNVTKDDSMLLVNTIQEKSSITITTTTTTSTEKTSTLDSNKLISEASTPSEPEDEENSDLELKIDDSKLDMIFKNLVEIVTDSRHHFNTEQIHELHHTIYRHINDERSNIDKSNLLKKIEDVVKNASKKHKKKREV